MSEQAPALPEWNAENVLDALNDFERKPDLSPTLDGYLVRIAKNGEIVFPWNKLKPLLRKKMEIVLDDFSVKNPVEPNVTVPNFEAFNYEELKKTILQAVDSFTSAPFTIQRICELITDPKRHYNRTDKYMRGIEKNVLVVSTIEHRIGQGDGNANPVVNGLLNDSMRDENDTMNGHENSDSVSSSNLNTPANHVLLENFANVFPAAACIPSASNICLNREVDNNFMNTSECVDSQEVEFDSNPPVEELTSTPIKDEAMDTSEDEQVTPPSESAGNNNEVSSGTIDTCPISEASEPAEEEEEKIDETVAESSDVDVEPEPAESSESSDKSEDESKNEAECCDAGIEPATCSPPPPAEEPPKPAIVNPVECQQDDTISQSDDDSHSTTPEPPVAEGSSEVEVSPGDEPLITPEPETSPNVTTSESSESSEQCMELESSSENTEEPHV